MCHLWVVVQSQLAGSGVYEIIARFPRKGSSALKMKQLFSCIKIKQTGQKQVSKCDPMSVEHLLPLLDPLLGQLPQEVLRRWVSASVLPAQMGLPPPQRGGPWCFLQNSH